ncbi:MAG: AAA family ATPase, partial [Solobacterium sp.]|nr:AAA family ATPase [Solobacterium sp.]
MESVGGNVVDLRDNYDAVFHLVTAAKGAEEFYTLENNAARYETIEEAVALDDRLIAAWTGHPHFRIIDNSMNFDKKLQNLLNEMLAVVGEDTTI